MIQTEADTRRCGTSDRAAAGGSAAETHNITKPQVAAGVPRRNGRQVEGRFRHVSRRIQPLSCNASLFDAHLHPKRR